MTGRLQFGARARGVVLILMDVDGVLTDGGITYTGTRRESRTFHARDGVGLVIARRLGLRTGVISGRGSAAVLRRARELKLDEVHLRSEDKLAAYEGILRRRHLSDAQVCYIGDDLPDLPVLRRAGLAVAVGDAHSEILRSAPFITRARGGYGAVREVVDAILRAQGRWSDAVGLYARKEP